MKKLLFTVATLASIASIAANITGPHHRLEGELGFPLKIAKVKETVNGSQVDKTKIWSKETDLRMAYIPEWNYEVNDKIDLVFGPRITVGDKILTAYQFDKEKENIHGITATVGGEMNIDFKLPNTDTKPFIGLGLGVGGHGYFDFNSSPKTLGGGHVVNVDLTVGAKLSEKIKLAVILGYENSGIKTKNTTATLDELGLKDSEYNMSHSFRPGIKFGYILGE